MLYYRGGRISAVSKQKYFLTLLSQPYQDAAFTDVAFVVAAETNLWLVKELEEVLKDTLATVTRLLTARGSYRSYYRRRRSWRLI